MHACAVSVYQALFFENLVTRLGALLCMDIFIAQYKRNESEQAQIFYFGYVRVHHKSKMCMLLATANSLVVYVYVI